MAAVITVRWAASFSSARRRLPNGAEATNSMLPRRDSRASVPDRARIDHRLATKMKNGPYFQDM